MTLAVLAFLSFLAGFVDSIAGGGGLILTPALMVLRPDLALATVLGTNKFAAMTGTSWAAWQYRKVVRLPWRVMGPAVAAGFACAMLGAWVITALQQFNVRPMVIALLAVLLVYTLRRKQLGSAERPLPPGARARGMGIAGAVGFYDGFFGPGTGSFLIFGFIRWLGFPFLGASAAAKAVNTATNLAALLLFAWAGHLDLRLALPLAVANFVGSQVGVKVAARGGNRLVRAVFLVVTGVLLVKLTVDEVRAHRHPPGIPRARATVSPALPVPVDPAGPDLNHQPGLRVRGSARGHEAALTV